jgi:hypothetical protein
MAEIDDGGQAFPNEGFNGWGTPETGMTLRDYFAAKAMHALILNHATTSPHLSLSGRAYEIADTMLAARSK